MDDKPAGQVRSPDNLLSIPSMRLKFQGVWRTGLRLGRDHAVGSYGRAKLPLSQKHTAAQRELRPTDCGSQQQDLKITPSTRTVRTTRPLGNSRTTGRVAG